MHPPLRKAPLLMLVLAAAPLCGHASEASDYLAAQAYADGVIQGENPLAADLQATAAAIEAFGADPPDADPSATALNYSQGQNELTIKNA